MFVFKFIFQKRLFVLAFFLLTSKFWGQQNIDSLINLLSHHPQLDNVRIHILQDLFDEYYFNTDLDSASRYAELIRQQSIQTKDTLQLAIANRVNGSLLRYQGKYFKAEINFLKAIEIAEKIKDTTLLLNLYDEIAHNYADSDRFSSSIDYLLKALSLSEARKDYHTILSIYNSLGYVYSYLNKPKEELKYYKKAIHLFETKKMQNENISALYNNLGSIYIDIAQDTALYYLKKGVKASIDEHDLATLSGVYQNLGVLYDMIPAKKDSAEYFLFKALKISKKLEKQMQINTLLSAGDFYFDRKQYAESKKYFSQALILAEESQKKADEEYILAQLYKIEKATKNYKKALEYFEKQSKVKDSLDMKNTQIAISKLKEEYEVEKGKKEIELLKNQNKLTRSKARLHKIGWYASLFILGLFIIIGLSMYNSHKHKQIAKEQRLKKEAERKLLCAVIETENAERQRFAEDIHDGVNPLLSSIKLYLGEMKYTEKEEKEKMLEIADEIVSEAITQVREISHNIKPDKLSEEGLFHSLEKFVEKIRYVKK